MAMMHQNGFDIVDEPFDISSKIRRYTERKPYPFETFFRDAPVVTAKETVQHLLKHEAIVRAWLDGKALQVNPLGTIGWIDLPPAGEALSLDYSRFNYRVKPVQVSRWAVYNCTPVNAGDAPYFLTDFPNEAAAKAYVQRNFGNDAAFGLTKKDRDLRVVELKSEIVV